MGKLGSKEVQKLYLPSTANIPEDSRDWVVINSKVTPRIMMEVSSLEDEKLWGATLLSLLIESWSFTDDSGPAAITPDNVLELSFEDLNFLNDWLAGTMEKVKSELDNAVKKN